MLNVYKYHVSPEKLIEYENHWKADPMAAVDVLVRHPERVEVKAVVLQDPKAIVQYVREVGKSFPEGLSVILSKDEYAYKSSIIPYAMALGKRDSKIEAWLLRDGDPHTIMTYVHEVVKGVWKEAEAIIARSGFHRREYVRMYLKGDWSKFDKGQILDNSDWKTYVQGLIDSGVEGYNEHRESMMEDDWDDEEEDEEEGVYEPLVVMYKDITDGSFGIFNGRKRVGVCIRQHGGDVELLDLNNELKATLDLNKTEDALWDDVYQYIEDVIVGE